MSQSPYLPVALQAVKEAQAILTRYYRSEIQVTLKADQSPVTIADQEAEKCIRSIISNAFPDHRILGEEEGTTTTDSSYLWIIDPIDATKNYLRHIPLFATQLALMKDGEVILGVSSAPEIGELLYAEKGQGTYCNDTKISVSGKSSIQEAYLSYGSVGYFHTTGRMEQFLKLENETQAHRGFGDFWGYHLLAQGKVDIMLEGNTKLWDIAAVSIIVSEAGGTVTDFEGNPINESTRSIIATNGLLHNVVAGYFV